VYQGVANEGRPKYYRTENEPKTEPVQGKSHAKRKPKDEGERDRIHRRKETTPPQREERRTRQEKREGFSQSLGGEKVERRRNSAISRKYLPDNIRFTGSKRHGGVVVLV